VTDLLAVTGDPVRDLRAAWETAQQNAAAEREYAAAALHNVGVPAISGASIHVRADDDSAGQAIVATVRRAIPDAKLWRFEARPPGLPRYEEQDLPRLLRDLRRDSA
jgi:hypothetical protein